MVANLKFGMVEQFEIAYTTAEPPFLAIDVHIFYEFIEFPPLYLLIGHFVPIYLLNAKFTLGGSNAEILTNALDNGAQRVDLQRPSIFFGLW